MPASARQSGPKPARWRSRTTRQTGRARPSAWQHEPAGRRPTGWGRRCDRGCAGKGVEGIGPRSSEPGPTAPTTCPPWDHRRELSRQRASSTEPSRETRTDWTAKVTATVAVYRRFGPPSSAIMGRLRPSFGVSSPARPRPTLPVLWDTLGRDIGTPVWDASRSLRSVCESAARARGATRWVGTCRRRRCRSGSRPLERLAELGRAVEQP